jgi:hypothetical protein
MSYIVAAHASPPPLFGLNRVAVYRRPLPSRFLSFAYIATCRSHTSHLSFAYIAPVFEIGVAVGIVFGVAGLVGLVLGLVAVGERGAMQAGC